MGWEACRTDKALSVGLIGPQKCCFALVCTIAGKSWLGYSHHCASIQTLVPFHFFVLYRPLTKTGVPGAITKFPRSAPFEGPTGEDLAIFLPAWVG